MVLLYNSIIESVNGRFQIHYAIAENVNQLDGMYN